MNQKTSLFDIAVIKIKVSEDLVDEHNGIIQPCPESLEYAEGYAIGMGLVNVDPDVNAQVLMGINQFLVPSCNR